MIDASASSQFVSGLLLSGARYDKGVTVHHDGKPVPSLPHIEMTVQMLREAGVDVDDGEPDRWRVAPGPIRAADWARRARPVQRRRFLAAAAVTGGRVPCGLARAHPPSPATAIRGRAGRWARTVEPAAAGMTVTGPAALRGVDVDLHDASELTPTVAAVAALADRPVADPRGRRTSAGTRPTGSPRSPPRSPRLGGEVVETAGRADDPPRRRCTAARGAPTPTTAWPPRAR